MPLSRPVLIALVGAILAVTAFVATSASRKEAAAPESSPAELAARAKKANSASEDPAPAKAKKTEAAAKKTEAGAAATPVTKAEKVAEKKMAAKLNTTKAKAKVDKPAAAKVKGVPPSVKRALDRKRVVVLFFRQSGSADDAAVAGAVSAQRGRKGVSVFTDNIRRLARYRAVVGALGISQAPAVVIVGRNGEARVVEGFVDEGSLTQQVVDSR